MQTENSVRHRASVVVVHEGRLLGFHAEDPFSKEKYFFLPGGMIESNESPEQAACRETFEETGYRIQIINSHKIKKNYDFPWNGKINRCATVFYLGQLLNLEPVTVNDASYHRGVAWVPVGEIGRIFSYSKDICEAVQSLVSFSNEKKS